MDRAPRRSPSSPRRSPPRTAFSLVEVLVALTILGVAVGLGVPKMNDIANQNRVHRAAQGMQLDAQQAFTIAGRNRKPVTLRWNSAKAELQVTSLDGKTVFRRSNLTGYGLKASEATVTPSVLAVFPNGIAADSLVIRVARGEHTKSVHVSRAGMVQVK